MWPNKCLRFSGCRVTLGLRVRMVSTPSPPASSSGRGSLDCSPTSAGAGGGGDGGVPSGGPDSRPMVDNMVGEDRETSVRR